MNPGPPARIVPLLCGMLLLGVLAFASAAPAQEEPPPEFGEESPRAEPAEVEDALPAEDEAALEETTPDDDETPLQEPGEGIPAADDVLSEVPEPAESLVGIEELVVTGQRRTQNLQDVPVSVTAFSPDEILGANMKDLRDIAEYTPNLQIKTAFAASNPTLFIRGVGLNDFNANSASAVAVYVDDIYMQSPAGQLTALFDLQNVEVLRGPQGSLYGRNASAGAIRVVARKPTEEFDLFGSMSYGRFGELSLQGAVGGGIIDDYLAVRGAFSLNRRDGITENLCAQFAGELSSACGGTVGNVLPGGLDKWVNETDNWAARGSARLWLEPWGREMEWLLIAHGSQNRGDATQYQHVGVQEVVVDGFPVPVLDQRDQRGYMECANKDLALCPFKVDGRPDLGRQRETDPYTGEYNRVGDELLDRWGTSLTGTWSVSDSLDLTSITGYEWHDRETDENTDGGPNEMLEIVWGDDAWQVSQELRLGSQTGGSLEWVTGAFFLHEHLDVLNEYVAGVRDRPQTLYVDQTYTQKTWTWAVYGHLWYELLENLTLEGGVRYNWEHKTFDITVDLATGAGGIQDAAGGAEKATWSAVSGDVSLNYAILGHTNVYLKYSRGWKGGHFNGGALTRQALIEPVEPESVDAFELGLKGAWFDRRLVMNVTGFYYRYQNLQVFQVEQAPNGFPVTQLINADDAQVFGAELDLHARPLPGLDLRYNFGWLESEYRDFKDSYVQNVRMQPDECIAIGGTPVGRARCDIVVDRDFSGNRLLASPHFMMSGIIEYEIPLTFRGDWGSLYPRYDFTFKDDIFFDPAEGKGANGNFPKGTFGQKAYWLHNARLAYRTPNGKLEVALWVRNIFDKQYKVDAFDVSNELNYTIGVYGDPRTYGLTASYQF